MAIIVQTPVIILHFAFCTSGCNTVQCCFSVISVPLFKNQVLAILSLLLDPFALLGNKHTVVSTISPDDNASPRLGVGKKKLKSASSSGKSARVGLQFEETPINPKDINNPVACRLCDESIAGDHFT